MNDKFIYGNQITMATLTAVKSPRAILRKLSESLRKQTFPRPRNRETNSSANRRSIIPATARALSSSSSTACLTRVIELRQQEAVKEKAGEKFFASRAVFFAELPSILRRIAYTFAPPSPFCFTIFNFTRARARAGVLAAKLAHIARGDLTLSLAETGPLCLLEIQFDLLNLHGK